MVADCRILSELPERPTLQRGQMADRERDPVCDAHRLSVAHAAEGVSALPNGLWLLPGAGRAAVCGTG